MIPRKTNWYNWYTDTKYDSFLYKKHKYNKIRYHKEVGIPRCRASEQGQNVSVCCSQDLKIHAKNPLFRSLPPYFVQKWGSKKFRYYGFFWEGNVPFCKYSWSFGASQETKTPSWVRKKLSHFRNSVEDIYRHRWACREEDDEEINSKTTIS